MHYPMPRQEISTHDLMTGLHVLSLDITPRCNLECVHCYADSHPSRPLTEKLLTSDWIDLLIDARQLGCRAVQFAGGEPTIHPDFLKLVTTARELGYEFIEVYTNGTRLSRKLLDRLERLSVSLAFSVYGADAETHDAVTLRPGSFKRTITSIRGAKQRGMPVRAGIIETTANAGATPAAVQFVRSLGAITDDAADRTRGIGRGHSCKSSDDPYDELCGGCWRGSLTVHSDGRVTPCSIANFCTVGTVEDGLEEILAGGALRVFRERVAADEGGKKPKPCNPHCPKLCKPF